MKPPAGVTTRVKHTIRRAPRRGKRAGGPHIELKIPKIKEGDVIFFEKVFISHRNNSAGSSKRAHLVIKIHRNLILSRINNLKVN